LLLDLEAVQDYLGAIQMETIVHDLEVITRVLEAMPLDLEAIPLDLEAIPLDLEAIPQDLEAAVQDLEATVQDLEATVQDLEVLQWQGLGQAFHLEDIFLPRDSTILDLEIVAMLQVEHSCNRILETRKMMIQ